MLQYHSIRTPVGDLFLLYWSTVYSIQYTAAYRRSLVGSPGSGLRLNLVCLPCRLRLCTHHSSPRDDHMTNDPEYHT